MKNWSGHIYFDSSMQWKELEKPFPEMWETIVKETKQNQEEVQYDQLTLELNMEEIRNNRKPIGYLKDGAKYKMVFPMDRKEIIIFRGILSEDIKEVTESIAKILKNKKVKTTVDYDRMLLYEIKKRKK